MKFGPASPADAIGGVTVHTLRQGSLVLKKGTTIGPAEVTALNRAGVPNDWWVVDLCFWPNAWDVTAYSKRFLDKLRQKYSA